MGTTGLVHPNAEVGIKATAVFMLFVLAFQGDEKISAALSDMLLYFQFTPSLLQFINSPGNLLGLGFVVLLLASFIFGRIYCGFPF